MQAQSTTRKGSISTVVASFLHFDSCFMLWGLLGALGIFISKNLGLSPAQQGFMVALPVLSGSLLRIPAGLLSDRFALLRSRRKRRESFVSLHPLMAVTA